MVNGHVVVSFTPVKGLFESGTVIVNLYPDLYGGNKDGRGLCIK